jgi:tRNA(adenine34) deaminase
MMDAGPDKHPEPQNPNNSQIPSGHHPDHEQFMKAALLEAEKALQLNEVPIGAVVVKDGQVIGKGFNRRETNKNPLCHAEMMAIQEASQALGGWRLEGCHLYVTLEPCPMCAGAIVQARIEKVIYGTDDPKAGYAGTLHNTLQDTSLNHQADIVKYVLRDECVEILLSFFRNLRLKKRQSINHKES